MDIDCSAEVVDQIESHWRDQLRPRLDGLSDDEYFWQPVPDCWTLSRRGRSSAPISFGTGEFTMDYGEPPHERVPVTTIAWRLAHLIVGFASTNGKQFGRTAASESTFDYPGTAGLSPTAPNFVTGCARMTWRVIDGAFRCGNGGGPLRNSRSNRGEIMIDFDALTMNYLTVWNEAEADARAVAAGRLFSDDVTYTDPLADVRGLDELAALVTGVQRQFPGWRFRRFGPVDGHGRQVRFGWELGPEDGEAPVAGFDVAVLGDEGRIVQVLGFLDRVPG